MLLSRAILRVYGAASTRLKGFGRDFSSRLIVGIAFFFSNWLRFYV